jgi:hypothetical protein
VVAIRPCFALASPLLLPCFFLASPFRRSCTPVRLPRQNSVIPMRDARETTPDIQPAEAPLAQSTSRTCGAHTPHADHRDRYTSIATRLPIPHTTHLIQTLNRFTLYCSTSRTAPHPVLLHIPTSSASATHAPQPLTPRSAASTKIHPTAIPLRLARALPSTRSLVHARTGSATTPSNCTANSHDEPARRTPKELRSTLFTTSRIFKRCSAAKALVERRER